VPPADRVAAVFNVQGGTIGRGPGNTLVLPDPNRFVSRVQAKVALRDGRLAIVNSSAANPLLVNDRELDAGARADLADGDELRIGLYLLRVRRLGGARAVDDAADMTQLSMARGAPHSDEHDRASAKAGVPAPPLPVGLAPVASTTPALGKDSASASSRVPPRPTEAAAADASDGALPPLDPLQLAVGTATGSDPFADLIPGGRSLDGDRGGVPTRSAAPAGSSSGAGPLPVPDDVWDDLARLAPAAPDTARAATPPLPADFDAFAGPSAAARNPEDPLADLAQRGLSLEAFDKLDGPIDALFDGAPATAAIDDLLPDPHPVPDDPLAARDSLDPMAIFGGAANPAPHEFNRTDPDEVPELEAWFRPPEARFAPSVQEAPRDHPPGAASGVVPPSRIPPSPPPTRNEAAPAIRAAQSPPPPPDEGVAPLRASRTPPPGRERERPVTIEERAAPPAWEAAGAPRPDELLQAFLAGAGIPNAVIKDGLTPEMMKAIGTMLATALQGTIELIATRAILKREVKANVTIIATTKNNPLKFLPDAESALLQMFGARIPGFMGPVDAMQDAFRDLRAHEVGVIAGMRAALAEVLHRFEPDELEKRLKPAGVLQSLLPHGHRARLWETFTEMYVDISREAQDDFQALFGKAFLAAYESEVARLKGA